MRTELQKQIEREAKAYAQLKEDDFKDKKHLHRKTLIMYAHMQGATEYAEKWQAAQQRVEQLEKALRDIQQMATFPKTENESGVALYNILKQCNVSLNKSDIDE